MLRRLFASETLFLSETKIASKARRFRLSSAAVHGVVVIAMIVEVLTLP